MGDNAAPVHKPDKKWKIGPSGAVKRVSSALLRVFDAMAFNATVGNV